MTEPAESAKAIAVPQPRPGDLTLKGAAALFVGIHVATLGPLIALGNF